MDKESRSEGESEMEEKGSRKINGRGRGGETVGAGGLQDITFSILVSDCIT